MRAPARWPVQSAVTGKQRHRAEAWKASTRTPPFLGTRTTVTVLFVLMSLAISTCKRSLPTTSSTLTAARGMRQSSHADYAVPLGLFRRTLKLSHAARNQSVLVLLCKVCRRVDNHPASPEPFVPVFINSPAHAISEAREKRVCETVIAAPFGVAVEEGQSADGGRQCGERGRGRPRWRGGIRLRQWRQRGRMCRAKWVHGCRRGQLHRQRGGRKRTGDGEGALDV